ncbi:MULTISPECIES: hypothetical protein [Pseudomonas]|uniref:Uncharacterized protein n=1 Tax=Pseudomonas donghuensis TaxID=1163398 RepID=A0AAP0XB16_9PSED|nr:MULTISPECIES: hypothetical protein [Pseudomonas]MDF9892948.1 hypothetical protein [Pseudomonas vranovensis]KDO00946.1 hypothetical protein BV82_1400 [Pseudomonas donghuensis]MBS7600601.1 hypothetical protein [Pseudomonas sp. RC2C2]MCP6694213.1 hypothetical protein [Pseudomonas donghuensis]MCP6696314.1 hypothetical protein [Pseudomonas donghuensis]
MQSSWYLKAASLAENPRVFVDVLQREGHHRVLVVELPAFFIIQGRKV